MISPTGTESKRRLDDVKADSVIAAENRSAPAVGALALQLANQWDAFVAGRPSEALVRQTASELRRLSTEVNQLRNLLSTGQAELGPVATAQALAEASCIVRDQEIQRLRAHIEAEPLRFESARLAELRVAARVSLPDKRAAARFARAIAARLWGKS